MKKILKELDKEDLVEISSRLDSYVSFVSDKKRKVLIENIKKKPNDETINVIDQQIRYFASSDIASACRKALGKEPYVSSDVMLDDIIDKMKFNINKHLPLEDKLKRIVKEIVRKELVNAKPEDIAKMLKANDIDYSDISEVIHLIEQDEGDVVETMIESLGQSLATSLIFSIIQKAILLIAGQTALRIVTGQIAKRTPGLQILGPIIWALTGAWLVFDLQNIAYRKTIPICLFIGMKLISKEVENKAELRRKEDDKYNSLENKETKRLIKESKDLKEKYKKLTEENKNAEKVLEQEQKKQERLNNLETEKITKAHEELRVRYNNLVLKNSKEDKFGIKRYNFKVGQVRGIRDVFPNAIGIKADSLIMQDSYIRGKEYELDNLLRQFLNLDIIKPNTKITFISMYKYGEAPNVLYKEMNPRLKSLCEKYGLIFVTLKLRRNNEVHSRFFIFENTEMIVENSPDHSFYNLDRNNFAFRTFEEIKFK